MVRPFLALLLPLALTAARPTPSSPRVVSALIVLRVPLPDSVDAADSVGVERWMVTRAHLAAHCLAMSGAPVDSGGVLFLRQDTTPSAPAPVTRRSAE